MSSRKEDERNEKVIRGLLKLPHNRKCINCNSPGPQYVCTNFWTFICVTCSGIHREFTHRVKSISMSKFTHQEVEALQRGGNQSAREIFLKDWDTEKMRLPDNSNLDKLRDFIKNVYVDKKYVGGGRSFDKPPRDTQVISRVHSHKHHEDHRRASSYHSYSQSPPYEDQYEERCAGKQSGMLTRKPGSNHGLYEGKISSFMYSPSYQGKQTHEDKFANETPNSRNSDYSVTSGGDSSRCGQSPNLQDAGYSSPPLQQVRAILIEGMQPPRLNTNPDANTRKNLNGFPHSQRTASSSSFGSFDSNSTSLTPSSSSTIIDLVVDLDNASPSKDSEMSVSPSLMQTSVSTHSTRQDLFSLQNMAQTVPSSDSFANAYSVNHQFSSTILPEKKDLPKPLCESVGWATFDLPHQANHSELKKDPPVVSQANIHPFSHNATKDLFSHIADQANKFTPSSDACKSSQIWDAFGISNGGFQATSYENISQIREAQILAHNPHAYGIACASSHDEEVHIDDGSRHLSEDEFTALSSQLDTLVGSSFSLDLPSKEMDNLERQSTNPFDVPYDSDLDANNLFLDMRSLQTALPDPQLGTNLLGVLPQTWFSQNSVASYISPASQGSLAYSGRMLSSQLRDISSQVSVAPIGGNSVAPVGGNPFA